MHDVHISYGRPHHILSLLIYNSSGVATHPSAATDFEAAVSYRCELGNLLCTLGVRDLGVSMLEAVAALTQATAWSAPRYRRHDDGHAG